MRAYLSAHRKCIERQHENTSAHQNDYISNAIHTVAYIIVPLYVYNSK